MLNPQVSPLSSTSQLSLRRLTAPSRNFPSFGFKKQQLRLFFDSFRAFSPGFQVSLPMLYPRCLRRRPYTTAILGGRPACTHCCQTVRASSKPWLRILAQVLPSRFNGKVYTNSKIPHKIRDYLPYSVKGTIQLNPQET